MLKISEHFEYYQKDQLIAFQELQNWESYFDLPDAEDYIHFDKKEALCLSVKLSKSEKDEEYSCNISSSYYIGLDRLPKLKFPVYVKPKINSGNKQLNYVQILLEALQEPENFDHLEELFQIKFDEEWIEIENNLQPLLTPFLIAQFLAVVKDLVKIGLKKSYYEKTENLNNRVKGKVLVGQQIKQNILKNRFTKTVCRYQEFGFDTEVNRFLKFVLSKISNHLEEYSKEDEFYKNLSEILRFCNGGFHQVSYKQFQKLSYKESNPFYKKYNQAIQLGNQILALQDYNISKSSKSDKIKHPPFWIDMSKLFELYVFKKLKERFPNEGEVTYHKKFNRQEPDFIIKEDKEYGIKAVVDAKYKPRYKNGNPSMSDARQLAGYTRLNSVYKELGIADDQIIPAYFIYPADLPESFEERDDEKESFDELLVCKQDFLFNSKIRSSTTYKKMYLQEIHLLKNTDNK